MSVRDCEGFPQLVQRQRLRDIGRDIVIAEQAERPGTVPPQDQAIAIGRTLCRGPTENLYSVSGLAAVLSGWIHVPWRTMRRHTNGGCGSRPGRLRGGYRSRRRPTCHR